MKQSIDKRLNHIEFLIMKALQERSCRTADICQGYYF